MSHTGLVGYALSQRLRRIAGETENPERVEIMEDAADEIDELIRENRRLEKELKEKR